VELKMKLIQGSELTQGDAVKEAFKTACDNLDIPFIHREDKRDARTYHNVRQEVSRLMEEKLRGRTIPLGKSRIVPVSEGKKLMRGTLVHFYPKKLKTDGQKFKYLGELFIKKEISQEIFVDLASVLKYIE
jgi:hypothetical protein